MIGVDMATLNHPKYDPRRWKAYNDFFKTERGKVELFLDSELWSHAKRSITMKGYIATPSIMDLTTHPEVYFDKRH